MLHKKRCIFLNKVCYSPYISNELLLKIKNSKLFYILELQPFLDFIINIEDSEDSPVPEENTLNIQNFFQICQANENRPIHITLYNIYSRQLRKIKIMPSKIWSNADSLLGIVIRYEVIIYMLHFFTYYILI